MISPSVNPSILCGKVASVLTLHAGALGDFVLALHVLAQLRGLSPTARIDVASRCGLARWLSGRGIFDRALDYESFGVTVLFSLESAADSTACARLRAYDLVLSFLGGADSDAAAGLRRARVGRRICMDPIPRAETLARRRHITAQWLDDLSAAGLDLSAAGPAPLHFADDEKRQARARLAEFCGMESAPGVIVHPGSGGRAKCFPLDQFTALVGELRAAGHGVAWMVGPTELDWYGPPWVDDLRRSAPVLYEEHVDRAAEWVLGADLYVGNDAGMTHVAAALGVPTVALFGPTDRRVWRPLGPRVRVIGFDAAFECCTASNVLDTVSELIAPVPVQEASLKRNTRL